MRERGKIHYSAKNNLQLHLNQICVPCCKSFDFNCAKFEVKGKRKFLISIGDEERNCKFKKQIKSSFLNDSKRASDIACIMIKVYIAMMIIKML